MTEYAGQEVIHALADGYHRMRTILADEYEEVLRFHETTWRAYLAFATECGRPPLTDAEKRQAILNYIVGQKEKERL